MLRLFSKCLANSRRHRNDEHDPQGPSPMGSKRRCRCGSTVHRQALRCRCLNFSLTFTTQLCGQQTSQCNGCSSLFQQLLHLSAHLKGIRSQYVTITQDLARVMNRIKALYRSWAIACSVTSVYAPRHRAEWLDKIPEPGVRLPAKRFYQQLDLLQPVRQQARRDLLTESRKHHAVKLVRQIPSIGPIRAALLVAQLQIPHRFRTKRQLWAYSGFALETHDSGEYRYVRGKLQRNRERMTVRGLSNNHNPEVKNLFKGAAISASTHP